MRDFFISTLDTIIAVALVVGALLVLVVGIGTMFTPYYGGFWRGIWVLVGGSIYLMLVGGFAYLGLGIYHNTRRTAEAVERLAQR